VSYKKDEYKLKDGTEVDSVTTIIANNLGWSKYGLNYHYWEKGKKGKGFKEAPEAEAGTVAHYLIDCHIKGDRPDIDRKFPEISEEVKQMAEAGYLNFREWASLVKFKPFLTEHILVSEKFLYGGRIDCIAFIGKKLSIIDWKCANDVYGDNKVQLAAYGQLWLENNKDKPLEGGYHLLLFSKKEASFSHNFWNDLKLAWEVFIDLIDINNKAKKIKKL
jgi:hypothetical protein